MDFCSDLTDLLDDEKNYFFIELKRFNGKNREARAYGTWHESCTKKIYGSRNVIIGVNKLLNFEVKGEGKVIMVNA